MPLVIPPGFAQVGIEFRNTGDPDPWYITFGIDVSAAASAWEEVAISISSGWGNFLLEEMSTDTSLTGVQLRIGQDGGSPLTLFFPFNYPGSATGQKLPQNCALLVTKVTSLPGRVGKGRFFVPNILSDGSVNNVGVIQTTDLAALQGLMDTFYSWVVVGDPAPPLPIVLLHNNTAPGDPPPTVVDRLLLNQVIATQRRRLR